MALGSFRPPFAAYAAVLREEPKMRAYLAATLVDAVGIAASIWAAQLIMAAVFVDQRTRASLVVPTLLASLAGMLIAGPLADWQGKRVSPRALARWRWRLVLVARLVETLALASLVPTLALSKPTAAALLPYFTVSAFVKSSLGGARVALEVDLLRTESVQTDEHGAPRTDERGRPLLYKIHLLPLSGLLAAVNGVAALAGLLLGNRIVALAGGRYWPLFAFDVATNLGFAVILFLFCHPTKGDAHLEDLAFAESPASLFGPARLGDLPPESASPSAAAGIPQRFVTSIREVIAFLRGDRQRCLVLVMGAAWMIELFGEFYDDKMILKQLMGASDETLWRSEILWTASAFVPALVIPAVAKRVGKLGRVLVVMLLFDAVAIAATGGLASTGTAVVPLVAALALDRSFTVSGKTLVALIQNSASSAAMRGRIAAVFGIVVLAGNVVAESAATLVAERIGIPLMMVAVGALQVVTIVAIASAGGGRVWHFGLHTRD